MLSIKNDKWGKLVEACSCRLNYFSALKAKITKCWARWAEICVQTCFWEINYGNLWWDIMMESAESPQVHFVPAGALNAIYEI